MIANPDQDFWGRFEQTEPGTMSDGVGMAAPMVSFNPNNAPGSSPMQGGGGFAGPMAGQPQLGGPGGPMGPQGGQPGSLYAQPPPGMAAPQDGQVSMQQFNDAWLSSPYPGTVDGLKQFMAAHPEYAQAGITLGGSKGDKVYGPGGSFWGDAVIAAGEGGKGKSGMSGPPGGGGSGTGQYGFGGFGSMVAPLGEFTPPSREDALNSPGLQFALEEANRMGQNSGAARGTLLNGRFQQALQKSNIENALAGYGDVYGRAANTFGINYGVKTGNQDRPFQKYFSLAGLGQKSVGES